MDLGNIGGFRVPKKALFSGFQPFFGHFKGPDWCQTKIPGHAPPAERSPPIAERICGFWFQGSFVQIMAHCGLGTWIAVCLCLRRAGGLLLRLVATLVSVRGGAQQQGDGLHDPGLATQDH